MCCVSESNKSGHQFRTYLQLHSITWQYLYICLYDHQCMSPAHYPLSWIEFQYWIINLQLLNYHPNTHTHTWFGLVNFYSMPMFILRDSNREFWILFVSLVGHVKNMVSPVRSVVICGFLLLDRHTAWKWAVANVSEVQDVFILENWSDLVE
jgi:hypothetical protein